MLKSFSEHINEGSLDNSQVSQYADDVVSQVKKSKSPEGSYNEIRELEYSDPSHFDLVIEIKRETDPDFETDDHFKTLQWEEINFEKHGFSIDANTRIDNKDLIVPEIIITLLIDPTREDTLYQELRLRLIDIITHELNHTKQIGWNRKPFHVRPSSNQKRANSKRSFKYFILPDEVESMVVGMMARSEEQGVPLDVVFDKYLEPFVLSRRLSISEYDEVFKTWIHHALENYPDAKFSDTDPKIQGIINSI